MQCRQRASRRLGQMLPARSTAGADPSWDWPSLGRAVPGRRPSSRVGEREVRGNAELDSRCLGKIGEEHERALPSFEPAFSNSDSVVPGPLRSGLGAQNLVGAPAGTNGCSHILPGPAGAPLLLARPSRYRSASCQRGSKPAHLWRAKTAHAARVTRPPAPAPSTLHLALGRVARPQPLVGFPAGPGAGSSGPGRAFFTPFASGRPR